jgi:hypothetical protein
VKQGDFVVLFTKTGSRNQFDNKSDSVTYAFYLGLDAPIWTDDNKAAILFDIGEWSARGPSEEN